MTARPRRHGPSDGFTLIEVLVTVVIVGIGVAGLMGGILTAASGSGASQRYADKRQQLAAAAERIQAAGYQPATATGNCDTDPLSAYTAAIGSVVAPANNSGGANTATKPTIVGIWYWNGTTFLKGSSTYPDPTSSTSPPPSVAGCFYDRNPGSSHMQRITLGVGTNNTEQLTFIKRQP